MEGFDWSQIWDAALPVLLLGVGALFGFGWGKLKDYVKSTETKIDDELVAKIEEIIKEKSEQPPQPE